MTVHKSSSFSLKVHAVAAEAAPIDTKQIFTTPFPQLQSFNNYYAVSNEPTGENP